MNGAGHPEALLLLGPAAPFAAGTEALLATHAARLAARNAHLPRLSDCRLPGFRAVHDLLAPEALAAIDAEAMAALLAADAALERAALAATDRAEGARRAALLGGMRAASTRLAQALKLLAALEGLGVRRVLLAGDRDAVRRMAPLLLAGGIAVRLAGLRRIAPAGAWRARLRDAVLARPLLAALGSLALEAAWRWRTGARAAPIRPAATLAEASARIAAHLPAPGAADASDTTVFLRRHQASHLAPLRAGRPGFAPLFLEHLGLRPRPLRRWLGLAIAGRRDDPRARAAAILPATRTGRVLAALVATEARTGLRLLVAAEAMLDRVRPVRLLLSNDIEPSLRLLAFAARARGVAVACIQHGAFSEPLNLDGAAAGEYRVWGPAGAAFLRRHGRGRIALAVAGHPGLVARAARATTAPERPGLRVLYATRANSTETATCYPDREADMLELLRTAWPGAAATLAIKPHPRAHAPGWYRAAALRFARATGASVEVETGALLDAIERADLVISAGGTAVLESVVLRRSCIFIAPPGRADLAGWSGFPCLHHLPFAVAAAGSGRALRELLAAGRGALLDFDAPDIAAARARLLAAHIGPPAPDTLAAAGPLALAMEPAG